MTQLPVEVIVEILGWMHPQDVLRLRRVCAWMNKLLSCEAFAKWSLARHCNLPSLQARKIILDPLLTDRLWFTWPSDWQRVYAQTCLSSVCELRLRRKGLVGRIPDAIGLLKELRYLSLSENELSGEVPAELGRCTHLTHLFLSKNKLRGCVPKELFAQLPMLTYVSLRENMLDGSFGVDRGDLPVLRELYLDGNAFQQCSLHLQSIYLHTVYSDCHQQVVPDIVG